MRTVLLHHQQIVRHFNDQAPLLMTEEDKVSLKRAGKSYVHKVFGTQAV